ncbi:hypothetical protein HanHA300_Chr11g0412161 [Helianthus annuus]|nr:hypothetical protein HanHA300_Chr11g0412161 [Helianthus annuus]KAJ0510407.1 hypothetical protein HanIR_Chr11g0540491 [Helianthus annuus]KAJ0518292.1 hypothetical protein HanHA89_Chr11g0435821 [Helianthus annuus]KAJ0686326.1 hypothetical protein HanLR1_Chr11g0413501 [Helianthus annuus]
MRVVTRGVSDDDRSKPRKNGQQTTRLTNSRVAPYGLTSVFMLLGIISSLLKQGKHSLHIAKALRLVFVVSFGIAYSIYVLGSLTIQIGRCSKVFTIWVATWPSSWCY